MADKCLCSPKKATHCNLHQPGWLKRPITLCCSKRAQQVITAPRKDIKESKLLGVHHHAGSALHSAPHEATLSKHHCPRLLTASVMLPVKIHEPAFC